MWGRCVTAIIVQVQDGEHYYSQGKFLFTILQITYL